MLIDWFTVIAQIINFLILVALLKHFLYGRIIKAMDDRERKIASRLEDAKKKEDEAKREADSYREKNQEIEERRRELLSQAGEDAEKKRKDLTEKARKEIEQLRERWRETLRQEKSSFLHDLRQKISGQVYHVTRRAIKDLANADLEGQIVTTFIERIRDLGEKEQKAITTPLAEGDQAITITSVFEIAPNERQRITKALRSSLREGVEVEYETSPDMILGIELRSNGRKLSWSIGSYLESLESKIGLLLEEEGKESSEKDREEQKENES